MHKDHLKLYERIDGKLNMKNRNAFITAWEISHRKCHLVSAFFPLLQEPVLLITSVKRNPSKEITN